MRLSVIFSSLLLVLSVSASLSRRARRDIVRVKATTNVGVEYHTVSLKRDKGYGHTNIRGREILNATIQTAAEDFDIRCHYTSDPGPKRSWISREFSAGNPLQYVSRGFEGAVGLICHIHVENLLRVAIEPGVEGDKVLNIDLRPTEYVDSYQRIYSLYEKTGSLWRIDRAARIDGPGRAQCFIKHDDDKGADYKLKPLGGSLVFDEPLEGVSQITCYYQPL